MDSTQGFPLEVRLSAYLDGRLPEAEMEEIDTLLANDADARAVLGRLRTGSASDTRAFGTPSQEPAPAAPAKAITEAAAPKAGTPPESVGPAAARVSRRRRRFWMQTISASLALFLAGAAAGYLIAMGREAGTPPQIAVTRGWLDDIADYHRIYSRQTRHLTEVPAGDDDHIVEWLSASTGVTFRLPDLSAQKLIFEGARLLVAGGKPTGQLLYRDTDGEIFAICFRQGEPVESRTALTENMRNDIGLVSWQRGTAVFVVVGPSADPDLERLAETVSTTI